MRWTIVRDIELRNGCREVLINMSSQTWQNMEWKHKIRLFLPKNMAKTDIKTLLMVTSSFMEGAKNDEKAQEYGLKIVEQVDSPIAMLYDIPNQPLFDGLNEDQLLAESLERYSKTGDETWPIIFPMVKSVVKAMDCISEFLAQDAQLDCHQYVVTGASKRAWTTWFMPVIEPRVIAIVPMVYNNLNIERQLQHQLDSWGKYSEQISAYTDKNLPQKLKDKDPKIQALVKLIDPFVYHDQLKVPKLLVNATNDRFWTLDALNHYYDELPGQKYIYFAPNAEHNLQYGKDNTMSTIAAFFKSVDGRLDFPEVTATYAESEQQVVVNLNTTGEPWEVVLMRASANTRDFREAHWDEVLMHKKRNTYEMHVKKSEYTYSAMFCQAVYFENGSEFCLSSNIHIAMPSGNSKSP